MKIGVVIPNGSAKSLFTPAAWSALNHLGTVVANLDDVQLSPDAAVAMLAGCEIGVGSWGTVHPGTPGLLARLPDLRMWAHAAGTVKHMITPEVAARGLVVASAAPAIADDVAEMTVGEIIVGLRRVIPNGLANRAGGRPAAIGKRTMPFATVGVVGASNVGRSVIRLLQPFGCQVLLYDPYLSAEQVRELGAEKMDDITELCARSHAVTLHTPPLPETTNIIGKAQLQAMPDDAVFINTSRGVCVDEAALIAELSKGRLFAFLDVSHPEPAADDSPLRKLPNVIYTSHIAGGATPRIGNQVVDDIRAYVEGRRPRMAVTADMLPRIA